MSRTSAWARWPAVAVGWVLSRLLLLVVWATLEREPTGDVLYYHSRVGEHFAGTGLADTLVEYPTPVVWLLSLPWLTGGGSQTGYLIGFVTAMLALDAWLTVVLQRRGPAAAPWFWIAFVLLLGPLTVLRFDMIPAVLAGVALLWMARRPAVAGALIGIGAAVKLWPALLLPALLRPRRVRRTLLGFGVAGVGLALLSLLTGGWHRLVSPLGWQSGRGLQVESVWATPVMLWHAVAQDRHQIAMSPFQAFEIFGPGVGAWTHVATLATVVGLVLTGVLLLRAVRHGAPGLLAPAAVMTSVVAITVLTNKTFSPQYLLWLAGPVAVLLVAVGRGEGGRAARGWVRLVALGTLLLAGLTHLVYPTLYPPIVYQPPGPAQTLAIVVLAARNLVLVGYVALVVLGTWRLTGGGHVGAGDAVGYHRQVRPSRRRGAPARPPEEGDRGPRARTQ